jgi:predicted DCC family thiol-disulfide oxidoreductase YuxK
MKILTHLKESLSFDFRALACYRFFIGLIIISDVLYRMMSLTDFYTDVGLIPRSIFLSEMAMPWSLSFHLANGSFGFAVLMFVIHLILGMMVLFGYKTRWAMVGVYLMSVSVHNRNWTINNGGDDILRAILFLSIFLPLNKYFSIDSALARENKDVKTSHFSTWGLTFFLQLFLIYFVSYILKDHDIWRKDFTAVFFSSRLDIFSTPLGFFLRDFPTFQKLSSIFTIYLEWLGPILLIFNGFFGPFWWIVRLVVFLSFWALHIGIILTMWIGVFPYTCLAMWTIILPGPFWDHLKSFYQKKGMGKIKIFYDGECLFCYKAVLILKEFFLFNEVSLLKGDSDPKILTQMKKHHSWVVVDGTGEQYFKFGAMVAVMRDAPLLHYLAPLFSRGPLYWAGDMIYLLVSRNRTILSRFSQFLVLPSEKKTFVSLRWFYQVSGAFLFVTLLMWNLTTIKKLDFRSPFFQNVTRWLHIYQEWNMFAPYPKMDNIWIEIPALLSDGSQIELITGSPDVFSIKGDVFHKYVENEHWRKFFLNVAERSDYARYYGGFLCRKWNDRKLGWTKTETLRKFEIIVFSQLNLPNGDRGGISRQLSWKHWCFDEDYKRENPGK